MDQIQQTNFHNTEKNTSFSTTKPTKSFDFRHLTNEFISNNPLPLSSLALDSSLYKKEISFLFNRLKDYFLCIPGFSSTEFIILEKIYIGAKRTGKPYQICKKSLAWVLGKSYNTITNIINKLLKYGCIKVSENWDPKKTKSRLANSYQLALPLFLLEPINSMSYYKPSEVKFDYCVDQSTGYQEPPKMVPSPESYPQPSPKVLVPIIYNSNINNINTISAPKDTHFDYAELADEVMSELVSSEDEQKTHDTIDVATQKYRLEEKISSLTDEISKTEGVYATKSIEFVSSQGKDRMASLRAFQRAAERLEALKIKRAQYLSDLKQLVHDDGNSFQTTETIKPTKEQIISAIYKLRKFGYECKHEIKTLLQEIVWSVTEGTLKINPHNSNLSTMQKCISTCLWLIQTKKWKTPYGYQQNSNEKRPSKTYAYSNSQGYTQVGMLSKQLV